MSKNQLRFVSLGISKFAGIGPKTKVNVVYPEGFDIAEEMKRVNADNGLVIVFPNGMNYVEIEGDQEVGKTSLLECLQEATGGQSDQSSFHRMKDEEGKVILDKNYSDRFYGTDGKLYSFKVTKSTITLQEIQTDENGPVKDAKGREITVTHNSPKTLLQKIVGPGGISPMTLQSMNGEQQITWLKGLYTLDVETQRAGIEINQNYDATFKLRTQKNKDYNYESTLLQGNKFFKEYETWQIYFDTVTLESLQDKVKVVQEGKITYDKSVAAVPLLKLQKEGFESDINDIERQIQELQQKLEAKTELLEQVNERIIAGETYIKDNADIVNQYNEMKPVIDEAANYNANKQSFDLMVAHKKKVDDLETEKAALNAKVDALAQLKKDYVKKFSPDVEGLEVCIKSEGDTREGLFYNGKELSILAESELWQLCTQIWKALGVKIIYVDNINNLGTGAINKFNEFLATGGAYIFGTKMNRGEDSLKISFHPNIPI